ncbi:hypothetical protein [Nitrosopumilus spindle-shaped virus]|uniref:Uncharacterized protein n=1 Tax=Nitrosopumilus spindle-shaped virus TaxID=2508184 RepID=A0A514K338_9VIRU|nr:hypothetical protein [Nitrosopumilus spindle-shaped virus]
MTHNENDTRGIIITMVIVAIVISALVLVGFSNDAHAESCEKSFFVCGLDYPYGDPRNLYANYEEENGVNTMNPSNYPDHNCGVPQVYGQVSCIRHDDQLTEVDPETFVTFEKQNKRIIQTLEFIMKWKGTHLDSLRYYQ